MNLSGGFREFTGVEIRGISYDSRRVQPGDLFVAIAGHYEDGHRFVGEAVRKGAVAVVGESEEVASDQLIHFLPVPDSRAALALLSSCYLGEPSMQLLLVGVTGTNGKTTTTYLIEAMLGAAGMNPGVIGTVEYRFAGQKRSALHTTPESWDLQRILAEMKQVGVQAVVLEVSSHALELERVRGCHFNGAMFTNLSPEHLDFHSDLEAYYRAKRRLFQERLADSRKQDRFAVLNRDDPYGFRLFRELASNEIASGVRILTFSARGEEAAAIRPVEIEESRRGIKARVESPAGIIPIRSALVGGFNLENILGAVGTGIGLGLDPEVISQGIEEVKSVPGRLETVVSPDSSDRGIQVLVDYAHTPGALENVLETLQQFKGSARIIVVLGCGGDRDRKKRPEMGRIAARYGDAVVVTSDNPRTEDPLQIITEIRPGVEESGRMIESRNYWIIADRRDAIRHAITQAHPGDIVLIAGKGHETYQIIGTERFAFDDRQVAREALAERYSRTP